MNEQNQAVTVTSTATAEPTTIPQPTPGMATGQSPQTQSPAAVPNSGQAQSSTTTQPSYVTAEQFEAFRAELLRKVQSTTAKQENRINKRIDELARAGITATAEQVSALIEAEDASAAADRQPDLHSPQRLGGREASAALPSGQAQQVRESREDSSIEQAPEPARETSEGWIRANGGNVNDPIWQTVYELVKASGTDLEPGDAELRDFFYDESGNLIRHTKASFVSAWDGALKAKKARLSAALPSGRHSDAVQSEGAASSAGRTGGRHSDTAQSEGAASSPGQLPQAIAGQAGAEQISPATVPALGTLGHTNRVRDANFNELELLAKAFKR